MLNRYKRDACSLSRSNIRRLRHKIAIYHYASLKYVRWPHHRKYRHQCGDACQAQNQGATPVAKESVQDHILNVSLLLKYVNGYTTCQIKPPAESFFSRSCHNLYVYSAE